MSKSILIVEDEPLLRKAFVAIFAKEKFTVHQAANGQDALDFLHNQTAPPDIIVLDLLMPIMGGLEFLDVFKDHRHYPNTKVLVLSNLSDEKTLQSIRDHGSGNFILKSGVSPRELADAVNELL